MQVVYDGIFDEVEIVGTDYVAQRGKPIEVADDLAVRLLEQNIWRRAARKAKDGED